MGVELLFKYHAHATLHAHLGVHAASHAHALPESEREEQHAKRQAGVLEKKQQRAKGKGARLTMPIPPI